MTIASLAHRARQSLARGLEALQALDAPRAFLEVAQPVARAMGTLTDLEHSPEGVVAARVEPVLEALREGLRLLQLPEHVEHPAAARGMAALAETLGVVVELERSLRDRPLAPRVALRRDVVIERDLRAVEAPLGVHGASNFYPGLAGGDVVAHGGLFVATYQAPKIGEKVLLKISLPGGYEFVAKAVVVWTRNVADTLTPNSVRGSVGAPGFGARFCEITDEGHRLIQRYVRNREPLFHEDTP